MKRVTDKVEKRRKGKGKGEKNKMTKKKQEKRTGGRVRRDVRRVEVQ